MMGLMGRINTLEEDLEPYLNYVYPVHIDEDEMTEIDKMRYKFREFFSMMGYIQEEVSADLDEINTCSDEWCLEDEGNCCSSVIM